MLYNLIKTILIQRYFEVVDDDYTEEKRRSKLIRKTELEKYVMSLYPKR
jgi:hypothetical protein